MRGEFVSKAEIVENSISSTIESLLENFDCQPVLFMGSGMARRYIGTPDWEGVLRAMLAKIPTNSTSYEYLSQKNDNNLIVIGSDISEMIFEWAWKDGKSEFPEDLFLHPSKSIFLKYLLSEMLLESTPDELGEEYSEEYEALKAIRPHAVITTNYDTMIEALLPGYEAIIGKQVLRYNLNAYGEVYHIHGSVINPETIIINKDDYNKWNKESKYFAAKLLTYFAEHPVIIFGYSLTDPNVKTVLQDIGAIVADETGLIGNVLQVIYDEKIDGDAIQTEIAIPVDGRQFRIKALQTNSLLDVFNALTARHELKDVNPALVRALAARAMKLTRSDIPSGNIEVNYQTLEGIVDKDDALPTLLGITQADDVNKSHPYTLSTVGEKLGFPSWNGANKLLEKIKDVTGIDLKSSDNRYHCAIKVGKKDSSISRKYSEELVTLLKKVRDNEKFKLRM